MKAEQKNAVAVEDLSVRLRHESDRLRSLRELFVRSLSGTPAASRWIDVLRGVSFRVARGELFAILGPNGAGKTTLLRALAGIIPAVSGAVRVNGRVAPLIDLGAGFDPELTGGENIELYGTLLGRRRAWLRARRDAIVAFSGLGDALDVPLRNYSSGMVARLGFSVATATEPDVLLVDEVLAVGDEAFRSLCLERIESLRSSGTAVVLVSHDLALVEKLGERALLLEQGRVREIGEPKQVVARYQREAGA